MLTSYQWWLCVGEMIADTVITHHGLLLKAVLSLILNPPCHGLSRFARTEPHMVAMMDVQIPLCRSGHPTEQLHQCTRWTHLYVVEEVVQHNQNGSLYPDYGHDAAANCLVAVESVLAHGLTTDNLPLRFLGASPEPEGRGFTRRIRFIDDRSRNDDIRSCLRMSQVRGLY